MGDHIGTYRGRDVQEDGTYVLWVYDPDGGGILTARAGQNLLRWLNHSDDPNAELDLFDLYARRPIAAGEEITIDYGVGFGGPRESGRPESGRAEPGVKEPDSTERELGAESSS